MSKQPVEPGSLWAHRNGIVYTVLFLANDHTEHPDKYPVMVVYEGGNGRRWARSLSDWHRSMSFIAHSTGQQEAESPAAQPADADNLSNFIRKIDGNNSMGAGVLAEHIVEWLGQQKAQPQVPDYEVVEKALRLFRKEFIGQDYIKLWESCWLEAEEKSESAAKEEGK